MSWLSCQLSSRTHLLLQECMAEFSQIEPVHSDKILQIGQFHLPDAGGNWTTCFFFSIAARTITALTVMRSGRKLRHLDIVGSLPKQNKHKQTNKNNPNQTHPNKPTKGLPEKARPRVKRCETCGNATLKLSNVLLQEVVPNNVWCSVPNWSVSNYLLCIYHTSRSIFEKVASSCSGLLSSI